MGKKLSFRTIGVVSRPGSDAVVETLQHIREFLNQQKRHLVFDKASAELLPDSGLQIASRKMMGEICDLVIVVGGDGSLLGAGRDFSPYRVPLLGINRGRLGFLTDISPHNLETQLGAVLSGQYLFEERFLLQAELTRNKRVIAKNSALNDVVFHSGNSVKMIEFELFIDGQFVYLQRSDGLIVSTPTGSTAYALSGGGPIMHPKIDAVVLVPMFPHTLSSRPIVVDGNSEIELYVRPENECSPRMSCDGQGDTEVQAGDRIYIRKRPQKLQLLHPVQHNFYESCRSKLGWSEVL